MGLLDKCCIFKCFIFLTVFCWVQFYAPGTSVIIVLHYYHIVLNFCQMNSVFFFFLGGGGIFRVLLFGKYFLVVLSVANYFLGSSEIPNSADPCLVHVPNFLGGGGGRVGGLRMCHPPYHPP